MIKRAAVVYLFLAFAAFGWSFGGPFDFDDLPVLTYLRSPPPHHPLATPPLGTATSGRPLVHLSFALNGAINRALAVDLPTGLTAPSAAVGFRATNVLLHVAVALLLFVLARDTLVARRDARADLLAFVLAGVWLIHPLQTEAVNYVAQRTEIIAALCYLIVLVAAMRHRSGTRSKRWLAVAVGAALLGAGSKEIIVTVPIVVALYDRAFFVDTWADVFRPRSRVWLYAGLVAAVSICVVADVRGARAATVGSAAGMSTLDYLVTQGWAIPRYVRLMLLPVGLSYDYGRAPMLGWASWVGLGALVAAGIASVALWRSKDGIVVAFLGTTFFVLLAPSSSFIPIHTEIGAERRAYLALAVVLVLVGMLVLRVTRRMNATAATASVASIAIALLILSGRRSAMYRSPLALWTDAARRVPTNARAFDNAATAMLRVDSTRLADADSMLAHALALDSTYVDSWMHRGAIAVKQNRLRDAESMYRHALRLAPDDSLATSRIAKLYLAAGQPALAVPFMQRLATASMDPDALTDLGNAYFLLGKLDSAALVLNRAVNASPRNAAALRWMGATLLEMGRPAQAMPYLEHAAAADNSSALTFALLASAYGRSSMRDYAERAAAAAVARAGHDASIRVLTARGLLAAGDVAGAERLLADAVQIEPRDAEAWIRLAMVQAQRGRKKEALTSVNQALSIVPDYPPARHALGLLQPR